MKTHRLAAAVHIAAAIGAALSTAMVIAGPAVAEQVPCTGPMAHCVTAVGGTCERGADGKVTMWLYDRSGNSAALEECIGKVYEAHGRPNPYKPASSQKAAPKR